MRFRSLRIFAVIAVLVAALAPASALAADPQASAPAQAIVLDRQMTGSVAPNAFAYYKFFYPGDGTVATINMNVVPDDVHLLQSIGFNVYDPFGNLIVTGGAQPGLTPDISADVIDTDLAFKGDLVIQVYNYDLNRSFDYSIALNGVPQQPAPMPAPAPAAAPAPTTQATAAPAAADDANGNSGRLSPGGNFAGFEFNYPGDDSVFTLNMHVTPDDPFVLQNVGFAVYNPNGDLVVRGGAQPGLFNNISANVISKTPGTYFVQLYNYDPQTTIDYSIVLLTAPPTIGVA
jgi:hypothetical protein